MDTPKPVPLDKLRGILGKAKNLMDKVESGQYETGHIDANALTEDGVQRIMENGGSPTTQQRPAAPSSITPEMIAASKMPEAIKRAMLENPIPQATMGHTFTLEDVTDFAKDEKPLPLPKSNGGKRTAQPVNENRLQSMVGLSENEVRTIVKDEIIEFLTKYFTKSLSEDVQHKIITQLRESGTIKVKK